MQLKLVILPLDVSGELMGMLQQHREKQAGCAPNFGIAFMTLAEVVQVEGTGSAVLADLVTFLTFRDQSEVYHPLVLASMACEMKLRMWHGSRSHRQQVRRLRGHADGCGTRPKGPGGSFRQFIYFSHMNALSVFS